MMVGDLMLLPGQPAHMDGVVHITNMATFHQALREGDFPVGWTDGYANYGLPMGYFAQQIPSYLGAGLMFVTQDAVVAFNLVYFVGTLLAGWLFYLWLSLFVGPLPALMGTLFFQLAPYRILNLYIRGALPEYFSAVFVILLLLSLEMWVRKNQAKWWLLFSLSITGLVLTHPMNAVTGAFIIVPYWMWKWWTHPQRYRFTIRSVVAVFGGLMLTGYYLAPLLMEIKYFYYSQLESYLIPNSFLTISQLITESWPYFYDNMNNVLSRGHRIQIGLPELLIMCFALGFRAWQRLARFHIPYQAWFDISLGIGGLSLFLTLPPSEFIYTHMPLLAQIQFPWRMLSTFVFIPPLLLSLMLHQNRYRKIVSIGLTVLLVWLRFPQLYGKNVAVYEPESYVKTFDNPHEVLMNPVWTGPATDYPIKESHGEIIEGEGEIRWREERNSSRSYQVKAASGVRLSDNTFYFPGWKLLVNGELWEMEYQDPAYRGVITYRLPPGDHEVQLMFQDTKVRLFGKLTSLAGLAFIAVTGYRIRKSK
jgi:hypothetical protein